MRAAIARADPSLEQGATGVTPGPGGAAGLVARRFVLSVPVLALLACASASIEAPTGSYKVAGYARPPSGRTVLVLHVPAPTVALRAGDDLVLAAVQKQLADAGCRVGVIAFEDYAMLVRDELASPGRESTGEKAADVARAEARAPVRLAKIASSTNGAALMVSTRQVLRSTEIWQSVARWDGQKRSIQFKGTQATVADIQGTGPGLSIEMFAHGADGRLQVKWYGGTSLPYIADGVVGRDTEPREDLFSSADEVRQGVLLALAPLLRD